MSEFLKFNCDLNNFIKQLTELLESNNNTIEKLLKQKNKTFNNFVKPIELLEEKLEEYFTPLSHLNAVNNSSKIQKIYTDALPLITDYSTKLSQNLSIYNAYKEIFHKEYLQLNHEQKRVLELNIQNFELSGANLDQKTKKRLQEINIELSQLSNEFSQNLLNATNEYSYIITDEKDIEGLPQNEIDNAKYIENDTVKYKITLQMPSYIAYMTYGKNRKIRETLYKAYVSRAPQNTKLIDKILNLKYEMSNLLGFKNYAQLSLATKMAKDEESVLNFLNSLLDGSLKQATKEFQTLQEIAPFKLKSHDISFYSELLRKKEYQINEEEYRPYFEQTNIINGLFDFLNKLFNLTFKKTNEKLWNKKASSYLVYENNILKAKIYLDLESRQSKRGGAWMHNWQTHCTNEKNEKKLATAFIVCNFPSSSKDTPSLLRHDDIVTLFHEMGHAIHHILSEVNENEVSGVNGVEWDAIEFPSQFLENFAYEPKVLKIIAKHYKTNKTISDKMITKLVKSKNFLSASNMLRQLEFSLFDFKLHTQLYNGDEVQYLLNSIRDKTSIIKPPKYNKFQNGFSHIFAGGYAAGYYSYKWAEVLSADLFYKVISEGIFNSNTAKKYLKIILHSGGSKSMDTLFYELMQREADISNLLKLNGIK